MIEFYNLLFYKIFLFIFNLINYKRMTESNVINQKILNEIDKEQNSLNSPWDKSIYFNKHFNKFINNDSIVRTYFDISLRDLKAKYNNIFESYERKSGIKLINNDVETIKQAKIILWQFYKLKQSKGQGKKTMKAFQVLECKEVEDIAKDTSLKISERAEKILNLIKDKQKNINVKKQSFPDSSDFKPLTLYQIEQYVYRNYNDYKYVKPKKVEIIKPKRTRFDILQTDEFNNIIMNNEPNKAYKIIMEHNQNNELCLTKDQIKQYVYRQKYKNENN